LIRAFRRKGHKVILAGAVYAELDNNFDIKLPDKPFPEKYTYAEVLERCPEKVDLILQVEPHFWFYGNKPDDIPTACWCLDIHRGGKMFRDLIAEAKFDFVFLAQLYYKDVFMIRGIYPIWLPHACDDVYIYDRGIEPECDIAIAAETGLDYICFGMFREDGDGLVYTNKVNFINYSNPHEYHERAALIARLAKDFDVRIYTRVIGNDYSKALQKGRIGFHRSLSYEVNTKVYEVPAVNRLLLANRVPDISGVLPGDLVELYDSYYSVDSPNFELDYEQVKAKAKKMLDAKDTPERAKDAMKWVRKYHTYSYRIDKILDIVFRER
jgi:hypothetical protein